MPEALATFTAKGLAKDRTFRLDALVRVAMRFDDPKDVVATKFPKMFTEAPRARATFTARPAAKLRVLSTVTFALLTTKVPNVFEADPRATPLAKTFGVHVVPRTVSPCWTTVFPVVRTSP